MTRVYLSFACPKERYQRKRHQGGELRPCAAGGRRSKAAISAAAPQGELPRSGKRRHPGVLAGRREAGPGMANAARWRDFVFCPPCGARKMLRAYAFPCIFRPLRKRHQPFIRHWRRAGAFPPPWTLPHSNDQTGLASPFWNSPGMPFPSLGVRHNEINCARSDGAGDHPHVPSQDQDVRQDCLP